MIMSIRKLGGAVLIACVACALATSAAAQDAIGVVKLTGTLQKVKSTRAITIGFRDASVPFSYLNGRTPIGYSIDLCMEIVEDVRGELGDDTIQVKYVSVNPQNRIALVADGAVDLECGTTTNNAERQKQVAFSPIIFVSGTKLLAKRSGKFKSYRDFKGRTVVVTEASTNEAALKAINQKESLGMNVMVVRDNAQAFEAVDTGKADAWAGDDVVLTATAVESKRPQDYVVLGDFLSYDPYGIVYRKSDPEFDALVKRTFERLAETRELARIYDQWFRRKLPSGRTLGITMTPQLRQIFEAMGQPTE
ncbi:MAG TPA: amino acid ABC transporter substrate-binding protein [Casimicrobiaceae bacterium]|nr:amino acid ABC transporter substrate-binding protein [Casimicrobiaceae bacterium]